MSDERHAYPVLGLLVLIALIGVLVWGLASSYQAEESTQVLIEQSDSHRISDDQFMYSDPEYGFTLTMTQQFDVESLPEGDETIPFYNLTFRLDSGETIVGTVTKPELKGIIRHSYSIDYEEDVEYGEFIGSYIVGGDAQNGSIVHLYLLQDESDLYLFKSTDAVITKIIPTISKE